MSKRRSILITCLLALMVAPALGLYFFEKHTENTLRKKLEQHNIQVSSVQFSFLKNKLDMHGLSGPISYAPNGTFNIASVTAFNPQWDALSPQSPEHPLVADEVIFTDLKTSYTALQGQYSTHSKSLHIVGWKQNLGKLLHASSQKDLHAYITAFMDVYATKVQVTHFTSSIQEAQWKNQSFVENYTIHTISPTKIASLELFGITSTSSMKNQKNKEHSTVEKIQMGPLELPSPAFLSFLTEQTYFTSAPFQGLAEEHLFTHGREYFATGLNTQVTLTGFTFSQEQAGKKTPLFSLDHIDVQSQYDALKDTELRFTTKVQGAHVSFAHISADPQVRKVVQNMLDTQLLDIDASFTTNLLPTAQTSTLQASFSIENLGTTQLGIQAILPLQKISQLFPPQKPLQSLQSWLFSLQIADMHMSFQDKGLIPRAMISVSKQALIPLEEAQGLTVSNIEKEILFLQRHISEENYSALKQCIEHPGTINISLSPTEPMNLLPLIMLAQSAGKQLPLTILCKPGVPLLEAGQKLQPAPQ